MPHGSMDMSEEDLMMTSALSFSPINQRSALAGFPPSLRLSHIALSPMINVSVRR